MNFTKEPILHNISLTMGESSNLDFLNRIRKESGKRIIGMDTPVGYNTYGRQIQANIKHIETDFGKHTFDLYASKGDVSCKYEIDLMIDSVVSYLKRSDKNDFSIYTIELNFKLDDGKIAPLVVVRGDI